MIYYNTEVLLYYMYKHNWIISIVFLLTYWAVVCSLQWKIQENNIIHFISDWIDHSWTYFLIFFFQNSGETSIMIDHALQHNTSLQNADRGISDLLGSGSSILTSLRDQRLTLKVCLLLVWLLSWCEHAGWGFGNGLILKKKQQYHFTDILQGCHFLEISGTPFIILYFIWKQTKSWVYT